MTEEPGKPIRSWSDLRFSIIDPLLARPPERGDLKKELEALASRRHPHPTRKDSWVTFGVNLSPANRYGGFKALRERWLSHIKSTLFRPVLLIDEAQEMVAACLNELRLLTSTNFDSQSLLTTVIAGDLRLPERFRTSPLVSLGTREAGKNA